MKKYHVATGDGKGYYGVGYESYLEAVGVLKISQSHDPQAHIVEEEYHLTNADRIRAMSDRELADFLSSKFAEVGYLSLNEEEYKLTKTQVEAIKHNLFCVCMKWLQQPAGKDNDE